MPNFIVCYLKTLKIPHNNYNFIYTTSKFTFLGIIYTQNNDRRIPINISKLKYINLIPAQLKVLKNRIRSNLKK